MKTYYSDDQPWNMTEDWDYPTTAPRGFEVEVDICHFGYPIGWRYVPTTNLDVLAQATVEGAMGRAAVL